jgi:hypothetical protein
MRTIEITTDYGPERLTSLDYRVEATGDMLTVRCPVCHASCVTPETEWQKARFYHRDDCAVYSAFVSSFVPVKESRPMGITIDPWQCCDADLDYFATLYASTDAQLAADLLSFKVWRRSPAGKTCDYIGPDGQRAPFFNHDASAFPPRVEP